MRLRHLLIGCLLLGCGDDPSPPQEFRTHHVITRFAVDPVTELGVALEANEELFQELFDSLLRLTCDGDVPIIAELRGMERGGSGMGRLGLYISTPPGSGPEACSGAGRFLLLGNPLVEGPLFVEGEAAEARLPIDELIPELVPFTSEWVRVEAELDGGPEGLRSGTLVGLARVAGLAQGEVMGLEPQTVLDLLVEQGFQPDLDVDDDGLERFVDADGDGLIDGCLDGDRTMLEGRDCIERPEMVDGYELRILFRVVDANIINR